MSNITFKQIKECISYSNILPNEMNLKPIYHKYSFFNKFLLNNIVPLAQNNLSSICQDILSIIYNEHLFGPKFYPDANSFNHLIMTLNNVPIIHIKNDNDNYNYCMVVALDNFCKKDIEENSDSKKNKFTNYFKGISIGLFGILTAYVVYRYNKYDVVEQVEPGQN